MQCNEIRDAAAMQFYMCCVSKQKSNCLQKQHNNNCNEIVVHGFVRITKHAMEYKRKIKKKNDAIFSNECFNFSFH